jgi:hypothetical protein
MSAHDNETRADDALRSLAQAQLQMQASRAASLDARAIGVMGIDTALATIIGSAPLVDTPQTAALTMLCMSAALALRCLLLDIGERMGPSPASLLAKRELYGSIALERLILTSMAADLRINRHILARKVPRLTGAFVFLALAVACALAGSV